MVEHWEPAQGDVVNVLFDLKSHQAEAPPRTPNAAGDDESGVTRISSEGSVRRIAL